MVDYEYGRIRNLATSLAKIGVSGEITAQILTDGEKISKSTSQRKKRPGCNRLCAAWIHYSVLKQSMLCGNLARVVLVASGCNYAST